MPVSTRLSTALERKVSYTTDGSYAPSEFGSASHNSSLGELPELDEPEEYQDTHGRFPIFQYIKKSTLPDFIALGKPSLHQCKAMGHAFQWAKYRGLVLNAGTRSLREVQRIPGWGAVVQIRHSKRLDYTPNELGSRFHQSSCSLHPPQLRLTRTHGRRTIWPPVPLASREPHRVRRHRHPVP